MSYTDYMLKFFSGVLGEGGLVKCDDGASYEVWVLPNEPDGEMSRIDRAYKLRDPMSRIASGRRVILHGTATPARRRTDDSQCMLYAKAVYVQEELDV